MNGPTSQRRNGLAVNAEQLLAAYRAHPAPHTAVPLIEAVPGLIAELDLAASMGEGAGRQHSRTLQLLADLRAALTGLADAGEPVGPDTLRRLAGPATQWRVSR